MEVRERGKEGVDSEGGEGREGGRGKEGVDFEGEGGGTQFCVSCKLTRSFEEGGQIEVMKSLHILSDR